MTYDASSLEAQAIFYSTTLQWVRRYNAERELLQHNLPVNAYRVQLRKLQTLGTTSNAAVNGKYRKLPKAAENYSRKHRSESWGQRGLQSTGTVASPKAVEGHQAWAGGGDRRRSN